MMPPSPPYAELHCLSNFSFLRGASHPEELVERAAALGYSALALTDEASVAGAVRAHLEAKERGLQLIHGCELTLTDGTKLVVLVMDRDGWGNLCQLVSLGRRAAKKGEYCLERSDLAGGLPGCLLLWVPDEQPDADTGRWLAGLFPDRAWIAVELLCGADDDGRLRRLQQLSQQCGLPLVAAGDVQMHGAERRALQDLVTAIRHRTTVAEAGHRLHPNGERHLRLRHRLAQTYPPALLAETLRIAERCHFSLDELRYEYPEELVPDGLTPTQYLRQLCLTGMRQRWPQGAPLRARRLIARELRLIAELGYEPYFLTVHDTVAFARSRDILCQGRGSAANSAVCYCLGITEVDPARMEMLFERFISKERNEPPDIDVDFEHQRREEVIQYLYAKYGRERAALAATVITYQPRSAIRETAKALGMAPHQVDRLAKSMAWWDRRRVLPERLREAGFDPDNPVLRRMLALFNRLVGFPRHLSQHVGGFVIARDRLDRLVPIENAAMPERTVIQWDKDDLDALGLLKVDVLGLGMLSAIRRALAMISAQRGAPFTLADIPPEDPATYAMICHADTIGVFQIESRAQMSMLPRLRPQCFYDLVIEVAIVRPGPIQGEMVHPYLRRRQGIEPVDYPSEAVRGVLGRTLGVPLFQEQVIKLAMVAAGFSAGEADRLRRAMAAWRRRGGVEVFERKLLEGMRERGYSEEFARRIFKQIQGFSEYGFPESHAASFALLAYASSWLKRHEPAALLAALLNSQPMGFYSASQLIQDAQRHGVRVLPVDVQHSHWDCTLEGGAVRLGLRRVRGLSQAGGEAVAGQRPYRDVPDLAARSGVDKRDLDALAAADALAAIAGHRRLARWETLGVEKLQPLAGSPQGERQPDLIAPVVAEEVLADYATTGHSLRRHPLGLLRNQLERLGLRSARQVNNLKNGRMTRAAGLVVCRQRPGTASGIVFVTLEDETGNVNVIVWGSLVEQFRRPLLQARLLEVSGELQREGEVVNLIARRLTDRSDLLGALATRSRDFH